MTDAQRLFIDPAKPDVVIFDGEPLPGRPRVHRFLALLLGQAGRVVDYNAIRTCFAWNEAQTSNNAKVAACHTREVLAAWQVPAEIETVYGVGYRLQVTE